MTLTTLSVGHQHCCCLSFLQHTYSNIALFMHVKSQSDSRLSLYTAVLSQQCMNYLTTTLDCFVGDIIEDAFAGCRVCMYDPRPPMSAEQKGGSSSEKAGKGHGEQLQLSRRFISSGCIWLDVQFKRSTSTDRLAGMHQLCENALQMLSYKSSCAQQHNWPLFWASLISLQACPAEHRKS